MLGKLIAVGLGAGFAISIAAAADIAPARTDLPAAEIVNRNIAARGGLQAWRAVKTMSMEGKLTAGGNQRVPLPLPVPGKRPASLPVVTRPAEEVELPFALKMQRPRKTRLEIQFNNQAAVQVFDGTNGWKLRPFLNRKIVEPYTAEELKGAAEQPEIDGPLVDYAAKGTRIEVEGTEKVENRDTYKLKLTIKDGHSIHLWIDAQTFLETKIEGQPRRLDGVDRPVEIYYRDYRVVNGLKVPFVLETSVLPAAAKGRVPGFANSPVPNEKIIIDKVEINPNLDAALFEKPQIAAPSGKH